MVACAIEGPCMAPPDSNSFCQFGRNRYRNYAFCHRYDQSAFNLLLANLLHYKSDRWSSGMSYFYLVRRNQRDETNFPVMC
ncbi:Tyrosine--tRNA ligase [Trichinella spiralis]|uniref:Tyrosine--tRNA ligase n=1 Tax=Trichinella spiralis TaxID=6334 RepID=A0ABR3KHX7_TRISP